MEYHNQELKMIKISTQNKIKSTAYFMAYTLSI